MTNLSDLFNFYTYYDDEYDVLICTDTKLKYKSTSHDRPNDHKPDIEDREWKPLSNFWFIMSVLGGLVFMALQIPLLNYLDSHKIPQFPNVLDKFHMIFMMELVILIFIRLMLASLRPFKKEIYEYRLMGLLMILFIGFVVYFLHALVRIPEPMTF